MNKDSYYYYYIIIIILVQYNIYACIAILSSYGYNLIDIIIATE